jgi:hypothetical protein
MPGSRAAFVLGMHRSGTSAIARGVAALGVCLGSDFLAAQPENPTGYWEDRYLVEIDERVLRELGLKWDSVALFDPAELERFRIRRLRRAAVRYCRRTLSYAPHWGFKDPRVLRILPFWRRVIRDCDAQESYVLAIRNPRSVAASLFARQAMDSDEAYRLWLVHMAPFLGDVLREPLVVVDYDLMMREPQLQLARIARGIGIDDRAGGADQARFAAEFLDAGLRHSRFSLDDLESATPAAALARDAYRLLYGLAEDRSDSRAQSFAAAWTEIAARVAAIVPKI